MRRRMAVIVIVLGSFRVVHTLASPQAEFGASALKWEVTSDSGVADVPPADRVDLVHMKIWESTILGPKDMEWAATSVWADFVISRYSLVAMPVPARTDVTVTISNGPSQSAGPGAALPMPVAHWMLDETGGVIAADSTGAHDGRVYGHPTWLPEGGMVHGALQFNGISDYMDCGTFNPSSATGKLTICLWTKWDGSNGRAQGIINKRDGRDENQGMWELRVAPINTREMVHFRSYWGGPANTFLLPMGEWVHIAATCDGVTGTVYRDGQRVASAPMKFGSGTTASVVIAAYQKGGGDCFNGVLDDIQLYDEVLSDEQIQRAMGGAEITDWIRAAYWDPRYPSSWVQGSSVRDGLAAAGYEILNADQLGVWMDARIADGKSSVVVFCQDVAPDTVYEAASPTCTLRRYLNAAGKIVWYGDVPLYYQGHSDGSRTDFTTAGSVATLGFNAAGGSWDSGEQVTLTDEGRTWGLTQTWPSSRPAAGPGLRTLARDSTGQAAAWVKHFLPGDTYRGFVRLSDCGAVPRVEDIRRLAEYTSSVAPVSSSSEGLVAHWRLDGDATDGTGGYHGTEKGNAAYGPGVIGKALLLDGAGSYVEIADEAAFDLTTAISVAAWVNLEMLGSDYRPVITKGDAAWRLSTYQQTNQFHFAVTDWRVARHAVDGTIGIGLNEWHHVAGTFDGSLLRLYVDGVEDPASPVAYTGAVGLDDFPVQIGANAELPERGWVGRIDDVRVYGQALTETEVEALAVTEEDQRQWGRLASPGHEGHCIKATFFFPGHAKDGSQRYECEAPVNTFLYTVHPTDPRHLQWSSNSLNRTFAVDKMIETGFNVAVMSSWGEDFLPCSTGWAPWAPMQCSPTAHDELFSACANKSILIVPLIESRADWAFRDEFPEFEGRVAPGTVSQIVNLVRRYLQAPEHPEWARSWARIYNLAGEARYAVALIHVASSRLYSYDHVAFAEGFEAMAEEVENQTGERVGFLLDVLPPGTFAPGRLRPDWSRTGPHLAQQESILGIMCFIPEVWLGTSDDATLVQWKRTFSEGWESTGIPFLMDVSPGYDAHLVFPGSVTYGLNTIWTDALTRLVEDCGSDGFVYNSWNGYTEGMAAMGLREYGDTYSRWAESLTAMYSTEGCMSTPSR